MGEVEGGGRSRQAVISIVSPEFPVSYVVTGYVLLMFRSSGEVVFPYLDTRSQRATTYIVPRVIQHTSRPDKIYQSALKIISYNQLEPILTEAARIIAVTMKSDIEIDFDRFLIILSILSLSPSVIDKNVNGIKLYMFL
jgi:hypothetical protein